MRQFVFTDLWRVNETEIFESREALEEYIAWDWEEYAKPVGDEKEFVSLTDSEKWHDALILTYRVRDYIDDDNTVFGDWQIETETLWVDTVQMTGLVKNF